MATPPLLPPSDDDNGSSASNGLFRRPGGKRYKKVNDDASSSGISCAAVADTSAVSVPSGKSSLSNNVVTNAVRSVAARTASGRKNKDDESEHSAKADENKTESSSTEVGLDESIAAHAADITNIRESGQSNASSSLPSKVVAAAKKTLTSPLRAGKTVSKESASQKSGSTLSTSSEREQESSDHVDTSSRQQQDWREESALSNDSLLDNEDDNVTVVASNVIDRQSLQRLNVSQTSAIMIYMGPIAAVVLHDATILIVASLSIAAYPTFSNWDVIMANQVPWSATLTWLLVAFAVGYAVALLRAPTQQMIVEEEDESILIQDTTMPSEINVPQHSEFATRKGYTMLRRLSMQIPIKVQFPSAAGKKLKGVWSTLKGGSVELSFQRKAHGQVNDRLMKRLLRNPMYRRKTPSSEEEPSIEEDEEEDAASEEQSNVLQKIGSFDLPDASSLKEDVIDPLFRLRGMDIFLTEHMEEGAEDNMSEHPFLIKQVNNCCNRHGCFVVYNHLTRLAFAHRSGLRDSPSFVVNMMTQWANILLYFEMPEFVEEWDNIVEQDDDPDDVKALKHFLNGDDEYRNLRLKMLPSLVGGPMPIRMVAPPKREMTIHCTMLPTKWRKVDRCRTPDGQF